MQYVVFVAALLASISFTTFAAEEGVNPFTALREAAIARRKALQEAAEKEQLEKGFLPKPRLKLPDVKASDAEPYFHCGNTHITFTAMESDSHPWGGAIITVKKSAIWRLYWATPNTTPMVYLKSPDQPKSERHDVSPTIWAKTLSCL